MALGPPRRRAGAAPRAEALVEHDEGRHTVTEPRPGGAPPPNDEEPFDWRGDGRPEKERKGPLAFIRELPVLVLVAFLLALLIKTFLVQAFFIPSESMVPTLEVGDRVLVNKVVYRLHPPRRGDIVVFAEPHPPAGQDRGWWDSFTHWLTDGLGFTQDPTKDYIKRVIALPGETIEVRKGGVYVDGRRLDEPYLADLEDTSSFGPHTVGESSLFVMGDNRANSQDSRSVLGDIPIEKVIGKAFVVIWPPSEVRWLSGK